MRWSLIFLLVMVWITESAVAAAGDRWTIAGDNVNLRRGPSTVDEIKRQLRRGQTVVERERKGDWHHVEVLGADGLLGWVHQSLLHQAQAKTEPSIEPVASEIAPKVPAEIEPELTAKAPVEIKKAFQEKAPPNSLLDQGPSQGTGCSRGNAASFVERRDKLPRDPARPRVGHSGREILSPVPIRKPGDQSRVPTELVLASSPEVAGIDVEAMEHFRDSVSYLNTRAWSVAGIKLFSEIEPIGGGVVQVKTTSEWFDVPEIGQASYLNTLVDRWASAKADGAPGGGHAGRSERRSLDAQEQTLRGSSIRTLEFRTDRRLRSPYIR